MIDTPAVAESVARPAAVIRFTIPREKIREVMGPAIQEVLAVTQQHGVGIAGPVFSRHFRMDPEVFDFEVGVVVSGPVKPEGRVKPGELPGGKVIRTVYHGGYEGLPGAWTEFQAWIDGSDLQTTEAFWECYAAGPESGPDPAKWRTELNRPLAD